MITTQKTHAQDAINWLENEYPKGIDLVYIDYRDYFEDAGQLQEVLKYDNDDLSWLWDAQWETIDYVLREYCKQNGIDELDEDTKNTMVDWLINNDSSNPIEQLLENTGRQLCYIETPDISVESEKQRKYLYKKYAKTDAQKKEIDYIISEQFYSAPVSFYFYVNVKDLYYVLRSDKKYITIKNAYFSNVDRIQGSNLISNDGIFDLIIPMTVFKENFYLDKAKGTGYSWNSISGMTDYTEAVVCGTDTKKNGYIRIMDAETSEAQKREQELQAQWDKTHTCRAGDYDINWNRHSGNKSYNNNYPCGYKCENCGTFWID